MNPDLLEKSIEREIKLKNYLGADRIVLAEDKKIELEEKRLHIPPFRATTGLDKLDACIEGFRRGQLIVISGPPKQGKSSLGQTFTESFVRQGHQCVWFSYELSYEELFDKFPMDKLDFYVPNYMESGNLKWVEDRIIEAKQKHNISIVFIDHLDFLRDPDVLRGISLNLSAYIGGIVQKVKRIAVEQNVVIFLMTHIRKNKWTTNDLPSSEELRDSGQIAQLADIVLMLIRKRAQRNSEDIYELNHALLGVMENRHNGRTKKIEIDLVDKKFQEYYETGYGDSGQGSKSDWL